MRGTCLQVQNPRSKKVHGGVCKFLNDINWTKNMLLGSDNPFCERGAGGSLSLGQGSHRDARSDFF